MGVDRIDIASANAAVTVASCLWVPAHPISLPRMGNCPLMRFVVRLHRGFRMWFWESVRADDSPAERSPSDYSTARAATFRDVHVIAAGVAAAVASSGQQHIRGSHPCLGTGNRRAWTRGAPRRCHRNAPTAHVDVGPVNLRSYTPPFRLLGRPCGRTGSRSAAVLPRG